MSARHADAHELRGRGVGDAIRSWWNALTRPMQWLMGVPLIALIAILPVWRPPLLDTPGTDFGGVMAQFAMVALIASSTNTPGLRRSRSGSLVADDARTG